MKANAKTKAKTAKKHAAPTKAREPRVLKFLKAYRFQVVIPCITRTDFISASPIATASAPINLFLTRGLAEGDADLHAWSVSKEDRSICVELLDENGETQMVIPLHVRPVGYVIIGLHNTSEEVVTEQIELMHVTWPSEGCGCPESPDGPAVSRRQGICEGLNRAWYVVQRLTITDGAQAAFRTRALEAIFAALVDMETFHTVAQFTADTGLDSEPVCLPCMTPEDHMLTAGPVLPCVRCPADRKADFSDRRPGPRLTGVRVPLDRPYLAPAVNPREGAI